VLIKKHQVEQSCPLPAMVISLLTFFRPVKKASRLSVREPTVQMLFITSQNKQHRRIHGSKAGFPIKPSGMTTFLSMR
jgi:hypothetical protein